METRRPLHAGDIIGDKYERVFHMGRLDYDSEGLILMTNDGELSQHVMHPKYEWRRPTSPRLMARSAATSAGAW